jgi:osmotically inducible lipoprotein OsmB
MSRIALFIVAAAALAACGNTPLQRAATGGAAGAAAGFGVAALTGNDLGTGALIGAGIGAAGGALTDCTQVGSCTSPIK